ncbi:MAG: aspartate aminotransferase family protein [Aestuariivirga sp.]|uniref:aspartate aminotransferase family protein n=1 Tax=Aestuariivirga sp. TaxID=2650926 RepID=UPI0025C5C8D3|nr:aspartate aminotransferase family protein [Aestuariivirga sp.]MCA3559725.1 aspartate aminotransferase family protein [Aestuariivirga sp.]
MNVLNKNIDIAEVIRNDIAHHFHPFTDHKSFHAEGGPRVMTQADGIWIWDGNGHKLLDGMSGLWCVNVGYGRKELAEAAYKQMLDLPYYNTFFKTTTVPATELAAKISSVMPKRFKHIFFTNSGSESNDTIVRFVRHYWKLKGKPYRQHFIARTRGYHGSTMVAANLGGFQGMHDQVGTEFPGFHHVQQPHWFDFGGDKTPEEFGVEAAAEVEKKILEVGPDNVAAFIGEPIQGAGGVLIPPPTYWPEVQRICRKHGVLIISDEVICGFGRTGNWWGFETMGFEPDIVPMAKGLSSGYLPIGAVAFADHLIKDFFELGGEFYHGMTYAGHPVAAAVALKNIEIIERENLVGNTRDIGPYFAGALASLRDHPIVGETRSVGLIGAIELSNDKARRGRFASPGRVGAMCRDNCFKNGLIMRACWDTMVLAPPLVIARKEIDELVRLARAALDATYAQVKAEVVRD